MPVKKEFITNKLGRDFVLYPGLLDLAHEMGLRGIKTHLVQVPNKANEHVAIVHASAQMESGVYEGLGDANPGNTNKAVGLHLIRMAETRAKARALRDATNVSMTAFEELADGESGLAGSPTPPARESWPKPDPDYVPPEFEQDTARITGKPPAPERPANDPAIRRRYELTVKEAEQAGLTSIPTPTEDTPDSHIVTMGKRLRERIEAGK